MVLLKAVDHSGNKSAFTAGKQGTALFIAESDVDIDVGQLLDDAGLSAVEVLDELPMTGNKDGRTVYLTTDQTLYVWDADASQWNGIEADFDNLVLTEENFPQDLKPIEIVPTLPTTGNYDGRVVMQLSDGKLYRYNNGSFTSAVSATDITGQIASNQILDSAITAVKLANNSVETAKIASAITSGKLADGAATAAKIAAEAIIASKLGNGAVTNVKLNDSAVLRIRLHLMQ